MEIGNAIIGISTDYLHLCMYTVLLIFLLVFFMSNIVIFVSVFCIVNK